MLELQQNQSFFNGQTCLISRKFQLLFFLRKCHQQLYILEIGTEKDCAFHNEGVFCATEDYMLLAKWGKTV